MTEANPRERIVYTAVQHLRQRGATGMALRGLVADASAPWGSLRHYFPRGKDQLVCEALAWAGDFAAARVEDYLRRSPAPTPSRLFAHLVDGWVQELERRDFARGCPVAGAVVDCADVNDDVRSAASSALGRWREPLEGGLVDMGVGRRRARDLSVLMLAALEGAILLARADRSGEPLRIVVRTLTPMLDAEPRHQPARRPGTDERPRRRARARPRV